MRSRTLATVVTLLLMAAGTGGVVAHGGDGHSGGSASDSQYRPGKGCGDKNHVHARHDECKNNGHDGDDDNGGDEGHGNGHGHGDD